MKQIRNQTWKG